MVPGAAKDVLHPRLLSFGQPARSRIVGAPKSARPGASAPASNRPKPALRKLLALSRHANSAVMVEIRIRVREIIAVRAEESIMAKVMIMEAEAAIPSPPGERRTTTPPSKSRKSAAPAKPAVIPPAPPRCPALVKPAAPGHRRPDPVRSNPRLVIVARSVNHRSVVRHLGAQVPRRIAFIYQVRS